MAEWVKATRIERVQTLAGAQPDLRDLISLLQGSSSLVTFGSKLMHAVINIGLVRLLSPRTNFSIRIFWKYGRLKEP